jgi:hypothetical protein
LPIFPSTEKGQSSISGTFLPLYFISSVGKARKALGMVADEIHEDVSTSFEQSLFVAFDDVCQIDADFGEVLESVFFYDRDLV